jgi:hypothetical protein
MKIPLGFVTPTSRIAYREVESWYGSCVSALAGQGADIEAGLRTLVSCTNQVSLIYSFAADTGAAKRVLADTLECLGASGAVSTAIRSATAGIHQNLARLAIRSGEPEVVGEHVARMLEIGVGCGEDEIHANFIAGCNAREVALFGRDSPHLACYLDKCVNDYSRDLKREAEILYLMRQGRWTEAKRCATKDVSRRWDSNAMWQLYVLLIKLVQRPAACRPQELTSMIDEVGMEQLKAEVTDITIVRLLLRLCGLARVLGDAIYDRALSVAEQIGIRHDDYYLASVRRLPDAAGCSDPFYLEATYAKALRNDAEKVLRGPRVYEEALARFAMRIVPGARQKYGVRSNASASSHVQFLQGEPQDTHAKYEK